MREIKFRLWDRVELVMRDWEDVWKETSDAHFMGSDNDFVPLEFTGLLDKNGKEIYEGDIVSIFDGKIKSLVEYVDQVAQWEPRQMIYEKDCEVIGNVYEHPELLKKP